MSHHFDSEEERKLVDAAKKVLMHRHKLSEMEAYVFIRKAAMDNKLRKAEIARGILENANA